MLNNEERPECIPCNSNFSLRQVLIDCVDVVDVRQTFYNVSNLYDLSIDVGGLVGCWVINVNFSNISAISWREQIVLLKLDTYKILEIKHKTYLSIK
jgi:hypothetical protein